MVAQERSGRLDRVSLGLFTGMRPMKSYDLITEQNANARALPFRHFSTDGDKKPFNVSPPNIGSRWFVEDGFERLLMLLGQFHGTKIRHQVFRCQYLVPLDNEKISKKTRSVYTNAEMASLAFECTRQGKRIVFSCAGKSRHQLDTR